MFGEVIVALIMGRHGHYRTGAISRQHIVSHPDRNFLLVKGVDSVTTRESTRDGFYIGHSFPLGSVFGSLDVVANRVLLFRGYQLLYQFVFWSQSQIGDAVNGIDSGSEDLDMRILTLQDRKSVV